MIEGWWNDAYYILFEEREMDPVAARYGVSRYLPGFVIVGLKSWDDFIVRDAGHSLFVVPTVPMASQHLQPLTTAIARESLERDPRCEGKIKWRIQPIVFGGNPRDPNNSTWISSEQHAELVRWWNDRYLATVGTV